MVLKNTVHSEKVCLLAGILKSVFFTLRYLYWHWPQKPNQLNPPYNGKESPEQCTDMGAVMMWSLCFGVGIVGGACACEDLLVPSSLFLLFLWTMLIISPST